MMAAALATLCRAFRLLAVALLLVPGPAFAQGQPVSPEAIRDLALGESDAKVKALNTLAATGGPEALELLRALEKG